jgi:RNA polymerase sigma factor (sigma-70 family)
MGLLTMALSIEEEELVSEVISGESQTAVTMFVRKYQRFVYSVALRHLNNSYDDADDASQEVFIRAIRSLKNFKGDSSLQTWLFRITVNVCSTMRKKKRLVSWFTNDDGEPMEIPDENPTPERELMDKNFSQEIQRLLMKLPDKQRETFCLRYYDELSYEEISEILGTSIGGLKANYFQAVKKLAQLLKESTLIDLKGFGYEQ